MGDSPNSSSGYLPLSTSVIQKAQENGFEFRYVGNENEFDPAFFQYRWNDGKKMTWDEQMDLNLIDRSRLLDFVTDLNAYTSMVVTSKIRFDNPGPYSFIFTDAIHYKKSHLKFHHETAPILVLAYSFTSVGSIST